MSDYEVHVGDIGTIVKVTIQEEGVAINLTDATTMKIKFQRKDKTTFEMDALIWEDDPEQGIIYCLSVEDTFDLKGEWSIQGYVIFPTGEWHTAKETFTVEDNISVEEV